jgi:aminopeptidase N
MKNILMLIGVMLIAVSCKKQYPAGVSLALNDLRKKSISDVSYSLSLDIPEEKSDPIHGKQTIEFTLSDPDNPLRIDFSGDSTRITSVSVPYAFKNQHIVIPPSDLHEGINTITIEFTAGDLSLNRNEDYLYTLFVPDRASTCFPLFDQPNLKATYELSLQTPIHWSAVSNGQHMERKIINDRALHTFARTKAISSYLFAFAAGEFKSVSQRVNGREMTMFYRETDSVKVKKNTDEIFSLHSKALGWLEDYTRIPYPFDKFDFALIPSFQYGGMEHPGSIFYNESSLFLDDNASVNRKMGRASLIAHETAHMWFGDLVTMNWFNDVWMKEVFANFMAAKIVRPSFPEIDHDLRFLLAHYPSAYSVDRTKGANPIIQPLDNLKNAGTMYGAIIYQKAPVVMRLLERKIGEDTMKESLREYLKIYSFDNAVWDDLVKIIDDKSPDDINAWSKEWVYTAGMKTYPVTEEFPNSEGIDYGYFKTSPEARQKFFKKYSSFDKPVFRASMLINTWESMLRGDGPAPKELLKDLETVVLETETNPLLVDFVLDQIETLRWRFVEDVSFTELEEKLWNKVNSTKDKGMQMSYFRALEKNALSQEMLLNLKNIWNDKQKVEGLTLSEEDKITLAYELKLKLEGKTGISVLSQQIEQTQNPDRKERLKFVSAALDNDEAARDKFFESLKQEKNREHEAWVLEALSYLHHPANAESASKYLLPSLELLQEIQLTGDIFFPQRWLNVTYEGHNSCKDIEVANKFLEEHPTYPPYLKNKILQAVDMSKRACSLTSSSGS